MCKKTKKYQGAWLVDSKKKGENPTLLEDDKKEIQSAIANLREVLANNSESPDSIKESFEQLQKLLEGKLT